MNDLSKLIYFADISTNISGVFGILAIMMVISFVMTCIITGICYGDEWDDSKKPGVIAGGKKILTIISIILTVSTVIWVVTPTKDTIYAIAASEVGEEVIKSPTATKAIKAVDAWLDRQIAKGADQ